MKRRNHTERRGVALLLILTLLAMFAVSVLAFMTITSNMADTAQNAAKAERYLPPTAQEDVGAALRNVLIGSNNERNPIGPFGVLENMYGDWKEYNISYDNNGVPTGASENASVQFEANVAIFPNRGYAVLTPDVQNYSWGDIKDYFERSGGVMTFSDAYYVDNADAEAVWNDVVSGSSTFVLEKVITNPTAPLYMNAGIVAPDAGNGGYWLDHYYMSAYDDAADQNNYKIWDNWHFRVELSDDLKRFVADLRDAAARNGADPNLAVDAFNASLPLVTARLNRPVYSGTGVGGFTPMEAKDAQLTPQMLGDGDIDSFAQSYGMSGDSLRIPFAFWTNAAAPDLVPYRRGPGAALSFRSMWAHLTDANYDAAQRQNDGSLRYFDDSSWAVNYPVAYGFQNGAYLEPPRLASPYNAADRFTLFLANYARAPFVDSGDLSHNLLNDRDETVTPSFHRPALFDTLTNGGYLSIYDQAYDAGGYSEAARGALLTALLRKLTPRPLPLDHWNFDGGNDRLRYVNPENPLPNRVEGFANALATNAPAANPYDVDADGDGVREAIWIPSGLPIRVDENGTPYATMFAYTILDLDGRVNVNTAGNWDQLPNKFKNFNRYDENGGTYSDASQPYNYVDELASYWAENLGGGASVNSPFFNAESLAGRFGWNDDWNAPISVAQRGEGRGTSNVLLYEALSKVFSRRSTSDVATLASNLLWRRNLSQRDNPTGVVDQSGLVWDLANKHASQPGARLNGNETDDAFATRYNFFRYFDPLRLYDPNDADANEADATVAEAKMLFPWRGKTTVDMATNANAVPGFDFADTAFRSYDPLGAQIYTYAPQYSRNPYWARQNGLGWADTPYSLPMLERLLRPFDADAANLPSQLVDDLGMNSDLFDGATDDVSRTERLIAEAQRADARLALTTLSSDAPSPSLVFPDNKPLEDGDYRGGAFGFEQLIRRNVRAELERVFLKKEIHPDPTAGGFNDYLYTGANADAFENKVEEITSYLVAMLPPEIAAGKKIDLNALARKNYWLDVEYNSGNLVSSADVADSETHNVGLVKRMEMARGLYLVVMTLLYEDMNAGTLYNDGLLDRDGDGVPDDADGDGAPDAVGDLLRDYVEGSFDLLKFKGDNRKDENAVVSRQLIATRIAQWCVNVVDFADPDATMTPFFFDPTPFDGWWVDGNDWIADAEGQATYGYNRWEIGATYSDADGNARVNPGWGTDAPEIRFLFAPLNGVPTEQMADFFLSALNNSKDAAADEKSGYRDADGNFPTVTTVDASGVETTTFEDRRANELIAEWSSREIKSVKDQSSDLGFRLVWGMERPDLVLTETLSFHDLGVADTDDAQDVADGADDSDRSGGDKHFDQVKRPEGSTYLELYCAANPNVPQSPELYDYDENTKQWRLRLTKKTPIYKDSLGRELESPVWRVAISDSRDPRGLNVPEDGADEDAKKANARSKAAVYRKGRNGVLDWLASGKKTGNGPNERFPDNEFSFFSMQTRQFRNLPTPAGELEIASIADLDLYQGFDEANNKVMEPNAATFLADWKAFNLRSSNVLGSAFAESQDSRVASVSGKRADAWSLREVELDRILWFNKAEGDSTSDPEKLGTAGKYPDALRTFCNAEDEIVYLAPNEYLVVGPDKKRSLGSIPFNETSEDSEDCRFGVKPDETTYSPLWINIDNGRHGTNSLTNAGTENLSQPGKPAPNYKYMVAVANIGGRGLNISEPLWTATGVDPYYEDQTADKLDPTVLKNDKIDVRDVPFEMPKAWGDRGTEDANFYDQKVANYPIVQDKLFGVGTVPAYKSAFVQRVADPNRPYHPLMNPYISVDWNAMDLTVFTGECVTEGNLQGEIAQTFVDTDGVENAHVFRNSENKIELAENFALGLSDNATIPYFNGFDNLDKAAFSSRQWGNSAQRMFVGGLRQDGKIRPNVWARGVRLGDGDCAGLEKPMLYSLNSSTTLPVLSFMNDETNQWFALGVNHTLGFYNDRGPLGTWGVDADGNAEFTENTASAYYKGLNRTYSFAKGAAVDQRDLPYRSAPHTPFEHLVWNDAPYSNPFELSLVPASAPGRFGLEFVREDAEFNLAKLYEAHRGERRGVSLGSEGVYGFDKWYDKAEDADDMGGLKERGGRIGPYLNFFSSSKRPGESLNLCRALEFVYTPSLYLGTQKLAGEDENGNLITDGFGNPVFYSARREPGKVNLNTTNEAVWKALSPRSERVSDDAKLPGTPWSEFVDGRYPFWTVDTGADADGDGENETYDQSSNERAPFQPAHTTPLWGRLDQAPAPTPTTATLMAQYETDLTSERGRNEEPLLDNLRERFASDVDGNTIYAYEDASGNRQTTTDLDWLRANGIAYEEISLGKRNNLFEATAEMQRLSGTTTNRSNVFAIWTTVGYFEVERCNPGVNMPSVDPDGNEITLAKLIDPNYKWYRYYQAIYPDGYTYGKELGAEFGETKRRRGFAIIDRSIPVDFRRGQSANYQDAILLQRVLD